MVRRLFPLALPLALCAMAQSPEIYKTRLAPVAIDKAMGTRVTGSGMAEASLAGSKLIVSGSFEGLSSPATAAHIHQGSMTGVRGPVALNLTVTKAEAGKISGAFDLTPEQIESLKQGKWYVQIHSEKAPEGNLWGWLLK